MSDVDISPLTAGAPCTDGDSSALKGWHSRGYLPHLDTSDVMQTVTYRLADSFPVQMLAIWAEELAHMPENEAAAERNRRIERYIDRGVGTSWLRDPRIAHLVQDNLLRFDGHRYRLHTWVVMPNHVHVLLTPTLGQSLPGIMHSWKSYTANRANRLLGWRGDFWHRDYYDRYIRDDQHYAAVVAYIEANPVRARLCTHDKDWLFSSARYRL